jgi:hypothetical protein
VPAPDQQQAQHSSSEDAPSQPMNLKPLSSSSQSKFHLERSISEESCKVTMLSLKLETLDVELADIQL